MFPRDLQDLIRAENKDFIDFAEKAARQPSGITKEKTSIIDQRVSPAKYADLSEQALLDFHAKSQIEVPFGSTEFTQVLVRLGILSEEEKPTGFGLLLFGSQPQFIFPHSVVKGEFLHPDGRTEIRDFQGPLVALPGEILEWVSSRIGSFSVIEKFERVIKNDFQSDPFREAIINAVVHRDYENLAAPISFSINSKKVIIRSPGAPVVPITVEQLNRFNASSLCRNPLIMYVFNQMRLAEQRGKGMDILKNLSAEFNLPSPFYTFHDPYLQCTLFRSPDILSDLIGLEKFERLNTDERKGLLYIYNAKIVNKSRYVQGLGFDPKKAQRHFARFLELKLVKPEGATQNLRYLFNFDILNNSE